MRYVTLFFAVLLCAAANQANAQFPQGVSLSGERIGNPQIIRTGDILALNPETGASPTGIDLFYIALINNSGRDVTGLRLRLIFRKDGTELARGFSSNVPPRTLPQGVLRLSSNQIPSSLWAPQGFSFSEAEIRRLAGAQATVAGVTNVPSYLPAGVYTLDWTLVDERGNESNTVSIVFNLTNPTGFVQLISPGALVGSDPVEEVPTVLPFFLWQGDAPEYEITIWTDDTEEGSGRRFNEENSPHPNPNVRERVRMPSYQFPSGGSTTTGRVVRPLQPGKMVYWQVKSFADVAFAGTTPLSTSPVYSFRIAAENSQAISELIQLLREKYGIQGLEGSSFVSWTGVANGTLYINSADLQTLINELRRRTPSN
ncbi:MAG: hypothetical protein RMI34_01245 [Chloroherpetonaceae bacterium]|nr:hypothetical protein [Chloroherpetonaceae bacterium]MCS7211366.1 hypothetical protein [Chloroherpetonaceae bacterium]MDW8018683.1 hypothetical protein [Chloroherpetonaceae bacterium]MDW8466290.1 hypothetical protein [Chloroherpetonaceae bacterium]